MKNGKKLCPWSLAALLLSPLPLILVFVLTDSVEPLPDEVQYTLLLLSVLLTSALPPLAKHFRIQGGMSGKVCDLIGLIVATVLNFLVCAIFISFFTTEGYDGGFGPLWYIGLLLPVVSVVAYIFFAGKKK